VGSPAMSRADPAQSQASYTDPKTTRRPWISPLQRRRLLAENPTPMAARKDGTMSARFSASLSASWGPRPVQIHPRRRAQGRRHRPPVASKVSIVVGEGDRQWRERLLGRSAAGSR